MHAVALPDQQSPCLSDGTSLRRAPRLDEMDTGGEMPNVLFDEYEQPEDEGCEHAIGTDDVCERCE